MKLKTIQSRFNKNKIVITEIRKNMYKAEINGRNIKISSDSDGYVSYMVAESPDTDIQTDYFADTFFHTIKEATSYLLTGNQWDWMKK